MSSFGFTSHERVRYAALQSAGVRIGMPEMLPMLDEADRLVATAASLRELANRQLDGVEFSQAPPTEMNVLHFRPLGCSWEPISALSVKPPGPDPVRVPGMSFTRAQRLADAAERTIPPFWEDDGYPGA